MKKQARDLMRDCAEGFHRRWCWELLHHGWVALWSVSGRSS